MVELLASGGVRRGAESIVGRANSRSSSNKGIEGSEQADRGVSGGCC